LLLNGGILYTQPMPQRASNVNTNGSEMVNPRPTPTNMSATHWTYAKRIPTRPDGTGRLHLVG
jgi:hypothetical protein